MQETRETLRRTIFAVLLNLGFLTLTFDGFWALVFQVISIMSTVKEFLRQVYIRKFAHLQV